MIDVVRRSLAQGVPRMKPWDHEKTFSRHLTINDAGRLRRFRSSSPGPRLGLEYSKKETSRLFGVEKETDSVVIYYTGL